jgi:hypothetical protein
VNKLEANFVHGYHDWEKVFHVSITDEDVKNFFVTSEVFQSWSENWKCVNEQFDFFFQGIICTRTIRICINSYKLFF